MTEFKEGDRLRVTMEVEYVGETDVWLDVKGTAIEKKFVTSIEKIEPPVETFGPGDLVRHKVTNSYWYLATNGYVRMVTPDFPNAVKFYEYTDSPKPEFTSDGYEKVELE